MTTYVYTSITANYIPKARVLAQTFKRHNPDARFIVFMAETVPSRLGEIEPCFDEIIHISALDLDQPQQWIFSHSVVEICTAIKGHALCMLLARPDCEQVFYLDPDIAVFDHFDDLISRFAHGSVLITPHQLAPDTIRYAIEDNELCCLRNGVYNLGFLGVHNDVDGRYFANWWRDRLHDYCYAEQAQGFFTDQKWIDLAPAMFPFIHIVRDPGYNVATWNLSTREVTGGFEGGFSVRATAPARQAAEAEPVPLRFYHFSGFDSGAQLIQLQRYGSDMPATFVLRNWYIAECSKNGQETFGTIPWEYAVYQNGEPITVEQRRLFRQRQDLKNYFADPFVTEDRDQSYYHWYAVHGAQGD
ncbi:MAG TPA: hypothetical protein VFU60_02770 [Ktedonobacterales bacterium]|nr:hypothetical protein [Ktedonobacterales bacterium]